MVHVLMQLGVVHVCVYKKQIKSQILFLVEVYHEQQPFYYMESNTSRRNLYTE